MVLYKLDNDMEYNIPTFISLLDSYRIAFKGGLDVVVDKSQKGVHYSIDEFVLIANDSYDKSPFQEAFSKYSKIIENRHQKALATRKRFSGVQSDISRRYSEVTPLPEVFDAKHIEQVDKLLEGLNAEEIDTEQLEETIDENLDLLSIFQDDCNNLKRKRCEALPIDSVTTEDIFTHVNEYKKVKREVSQMEESLSNIDAEMNEEIERIKILFKNRKEKQISLLEEKKRRSTEMKAMIIATL